MVVELWGRAKRENGNLEAVDMDEEQDLGWFD